ncbi:ferredoxin [Thermodesulforhabdus norvegica]|uniref:Ferredoxin n=1 Tax=Thermodesulforhabdus norvegica TaxID=39841 RepID=A0A1I4UHS0_9BACT|nr:ferredoxin [Thermodesulforhabdus norvegica]SFM88498.1 ferredoxin [Thermodesulforhabdus norvegica]
MKVKIDYELCMGDRNCNSLCPEVFGFDEDKLRAVVLVEEVPTHLEDTVRRAARECGASAIIIEE